MLFPRYLMLEKRRKETQSLLKDKMPQHFSLPDSAGERGGFSHNVMPSFEVVEQSAKLVFRMFHLLSSRQLREQHPSTPG